MTAADAPRRCEARTACCDGWLKITLYGHVIYPGKLSVQLRASLHDL